VTAALAQHTDTPDCAVAQSPCSVSSQLARAPTQILGNSALSSTIAKPHTPDVVAPQVVGPERPGRRVLVLGDSPQPRAPLLASGCEVAVAPASWKVRGHD